MKICTRIDMSAKNELLIYLPIFLLERTRCVAENMSLLQILANMNHRCSYQ